ncbi:MAG: NYN domain-containing protein [Hyphomicrobium sp.]
MKGQSGGQSAGQMSRPALSAVFVDYDNIYLSLKRKNEDAAKRFAKDSGLWLGEIASGRLITPSNTLEPVGPRRIVMSRCYGNPVPRRNNHDNSTDMHSFPFVRHHYLRAGFEAIDCPPLTAQLKNSADIRMVMDVRDYLTHDTYFDEFVILSGDADFTPVLHRLRAHARRTVIFANDNTAAPYTAIADGEIRESALISLLLEGRIASDAEPNNAALPQPLKPVADVAAWGRDILAEVIESVRSAGQPVPLEALADRAVRSLGHERTAGSGWGGTGSFRDLLIKGLPQDLKLSTEPPYYVFDTSRQLAAPAAAAAAVQTRDARHEDRPMFRSEPADVPAEPASTTPVSSPLLVTPSSVQPALGPNQAQPLPVRRPEAPLPSAASLSAPPQPAPLASQPMARSALPPSPAMTPAPLNAPPAMRQAPAPAAQTNYTPPTMPVQTRAPIAETPARPQAAPASEGPTARQQAVARIFEACQAPPLSPGEYRILFSVAAQEIAANGLTGAQTLANIAQRMHEQGVEVSRDDVRFVLEVVSESDPWFEQGASAALFAGRFRNFVVGRCRNQGLNLSIDELDLIDMWFTVSASGQRQAAPGYARSAVGGPSTAAPPQQQAMPPRTVPASHLQTQLPHGGVQVGAPTGYAPPSLQSAAPPQLQSAAPPLVAMAPAGTQPAPRQDGGDRWWSLDDARTHVGEARAAQTLDEPEEFPRIVKNRLRG